MPGKVDPVASIFAATSLPKLGSICYLSVFSSQYRQSSATPRGAAHRPKIHLTILSEDYGAI
nr:hypothetical protein [uncultured Rhodopila sp.]